MSTDLKFFSFESDADVLTIRFNRPEKLNALNQEVLQELKELLLKIQNKELYPAIYGIIFCGAGDKAFVAGADIASMQNISTKEAYDFSALGQEVSLLLEDLRYPTLACVHGFALGGGFEMALSCDLIFASNQAVFGLPEVTLGLIPGFGGTQRLAKRIGIDRAKYFIFTAQKMKAEEAYNLGIVTKLFPDRDALFQGAKDYFTSIKKVSQIAIRAAKKSLNQGSDQIIRSGLKIELEQFSDLFSSNDTKEGISAFLEKRSPQFNRNG